MKPAPNDGVDGQWLDASAIAAFLDTCPDDLCDKILELREFVRKTAPTVAETISYASLVYFRPEIGGTIKGSVCGIGVRDDQVQVGFVHGAFLPDPHGILEESGRYKRHVSLSATSRIPKTALRALIHAAMAYTPC